jgi:Ca-activated chloride channel homolog
LKQISQVSGGRFDVPAKEVFEAGERTARLALPLWPYLLMAALSLLVADVALRRIDFSLWFPSR